MSFKWTYASIGLVIVATILISGIGWGPWAAFSLTYGLGLVAFGGLLILLVHTRMRRSRRVEQQDEAIMGYPDNKVLAAFRGRMQAADAVRELRSRGFDGSSIEILAGTAGAASIDAEGVAHGLTGIAQRSIEHLVADVNLQRYDRVARNGGVVIAVATPAEEDRERAAAVLMRNGGFEVYFFGKFAVQQLDAAPVGPPMDRN